MSKRDSKPMVAEDDLGFSKFWDAFPKRVSKKDARIAWAQLKPTPAQVEQMVIALAWQSQQAAWMKDGGQYVPYPASWLRAERWTDEKPAAMTTTRTISSAVGDPMQAWLQRKAVG